MRRGADASGRRRTVVGRSVGVVNRVLNESAARGPTSRLISVAIDGRTDGRTGGDEKVRFGVRVNYVTIQSVSFSHTSEILSHPVKVGEVRL